MFAPPPPAIPITVAFGNGVGPEIMDAALHVLREAGASLSIETIEVGQRIYDMDEPTGILPGAWDSLHRTKILLIGPTADPQGNEETPADVIARKFDLPDLVIDDDVAYGINEQFALFKPTHGPLPELAGKNKADPSPMLLAAVRMLEHIGQFDTAELILNAWLATLENETRPENAGTQEFAEFVAQNLGRKPVDKTALASQTSGV